MSCICCILRHADPLTLKRAWNGGPRKSSLKPRFSASLPSGLAQQVERYAETVDVSMSRAVASLVRLGLESQENRKREFFRKLRENLATDDPKQQDRVVDEFRALILGH